MPANRPRIESGIVWFQITERKRPLSISAAPAATKQTRTSHSEGICAYLLELDGYRALFSADIVFANGLIGLINYPGSSMDGYRANLSRLAGLKVEGLFPGHLLFSVRRGQRHIDIALERIKSGFVPPSIGQSDITMTIPEDY